MRLCSIVLILLLCPAAMPGQYGRSRRAVPATAPPPNMPVNKDVIVTFRGTLKQMKKKELLIQEDDKLVTIRLSHSTKFLDKDGEIKPYKIDLETPIVVEAAEDVDLKMVAITVTVASKRADK